ncbi:uncharacterized protein ACOB8E_009706 [Sarcophilus harrisii]
MGPALPAQRKKALGPFGAADPEVWANQSEKEPLESISSDFIIQLKHPFQSYLLPFYLSDRISFPNMHPYLCKPYNLTGGRNNVHLEQTEGFPPQRSGVRHSAGTREVLVSGVRAPACLLGFSWRKYRSGSPFPSPGILQIRKLRQTEVTSGPEAFGPHWVSLGLGFWPRWASASGLIGPRWASASGLVGPRLRASLGLGFWPRWASASGLIGPRWASASGLVGPRWASASGLVGPRLRASLGLVGPRLRASLGLVGSRWPSAPGLVGPRLRASLGLVGSRWPSAPGLVGPRLRASLGLVGPRLRASLGLGSLLLCKGRVGPTNSGPRSPEQHRFSPAEAFPSRTASHLLPCIPSSWGRVTGLRRAPPPEKSRARAPIQNSSPGRGGAGALAPVQRRAPPGILAPARLPELRDGSVPHSPARELRHFLAPGPAGRGRGRGRGRLRRPRERAPRRRRWRPGCGPVLGAGAVRLPSPRGTARPRSSAQPGRRRGSWSCGGHVG